MNRPVPSTIRTRSVPSNQRFHLMVLLLSEILRDQPVAPARDCRTVFQTVLHRLVAPQNVCLSREAEAVLDALEARVDQLFPHGLGGQVVEAAGPRLPLQPAAVGPHAPG